MGGYNAPYYPPQVLQEAMALSAPVEMKDEQLLVQALLKTQGTRDTYKDALNALHGVSSGILTSIHASLTRIYTEE